MSRLGKVLLLEDDPDVVKAVRWALAREADAVEVVDHEGKVGPAAAKEWAESEHLHSFRHPELYDPNKNALAGTWYLKKVMQRYTKTDDALPYALADYNAGRGNVLRWARGPAATNSAAFIRAIEFPSTRQYVESIMKQREYYRPQFPTKPTPGAVAKGN